MADLPLRFWTHLRASLRLLQDPRAWLPAITGVVALVVSLLIVPGTTPSFWNWLGLLLIAAFVGISVLVDVSRKRPRLPEATRLDLALLAGGILLVAIVLNLFLSLTGTATLVLGTVLIAAVALRVWRTRAVSAVLCGLIAVLVPIWAWTSLEAAPAGLLLLLPLALLALLADRYMQSALTADTRESTTLSRSWRFLSWLCLLAATVLTTILAISGEVGNAWAVVGALGVLVCIGADAGLPQHASQPGAWSRQLMAAGFAWIGIAWLASL